MNIFNLKKGRSEIKYYVPYDKVEEIKHFIRPYVNLDPYSNKQKDHRYIVRSLYFDTPHLDFYYQKMDGLQIRKKLRIRAYNNNHPAESYGFIEIKRKYTNAVVKERAKYPIPQIDSILSGEETNWLSLKHANGSIVLGKFIYNIEKLNLEPVVLIVYDRDAFIGKLDNRERLTIDYKVRACKCDSLNSIYHEDDLIPVTESICILELKFDDYMPKWMRKLIQRIKVSPEAISKYCMGVEKCVMNVY